MGDSVHARIANKRGTGQIRSAELDGCEEVSASLPATQDLDLAAYYQKRVFEYNFASMCKMSLPEQLEGLRVLDIGCRRGKGVFKLSSRVGDSGHVIGVDWSPEFIAEATKRSERAWMESGLARTNMEFHIGFPEDLAGLGLEDETIDLVFVNSVINLAYDLERAFGEMFRVLASGGLLVCETVLADGQRDDAIVAAAREIGNNVQSAPSQQSFEDLLARVGFCKPDYLETSAVKIDAGFKRTYSAPIVETDETAAFFATVAHIRKP